MTSPASASADRHRQPVQQFARAAWPAGSGGFRGGDPNVRTDTWQCLGENGSRPSRADPARPPSPPKPPLPRRRERGLGGRGRSRWARPRSANTAINRIPTLVSCPTASGRSTRQREGPSPYRAPSRRCSIASGRPLLSDCGAELAWRQAEPSAVGRSTATAQRTPLPWRNAKGEGIALPLRSWPVRPRRATGSAPGGSGRSSRRGRAASSRPPARCSRRPRSCTCASSTAGRGRTPWSASGRFVPARRPRPRPRTCRRRPARCRPPAPAARAAPAAALAPAIASPGRIASRPSPPPARP